MEISTPGRICLFGEHQDYLGLPVIAMAISLRVRIVGKKRKDRQVILHKPDLKTTENFLIDDSSYVKKRDYFRSGINICKNEGLEFSNGFECYINSDIPIQAGTSSSSAIVVSWLHFLSYMSDNKIIWTKEKIGELAYKAEVLEFSEPGGMMDQFSTAMGGMVYIESEPKRYVKKINTSLGSFVLGDSCQKKETITILARCKNLRFDIINKIKARNQDFDLHSSQLDVDLSNLSNMEKHLFYNTIKNRDLLKEAKNELEKDNPNHHIIGNLLNEQHIILRDSLGISTDKIESMINAANSSGALGCKINGSGGGGCMFAFAPENPERVAKAIESVGGKSYIVYADEGTNALI